MHDENAPSNRVALQWVGGLILALAGPIAIPTAAILWLDPKGSWGLPVVAISVIVGVVGMCILPITPALRPWVLAAYLAVLILALYPLALMLACFVGSQCL